jgi:hypothetical protein
MASRVLLSVYDGIHHGWLPVSTTRWGWLHNGFNSPRNHAVYLGPQCIDDLNLFIYNTMPASTISNRTTSTVLEEYYQAASKSLLLRQLEQASDICQQSLKTLLSDTSLHLSVEGADWLRKLWLLRVAIVTAHLDTGNKIDADAIQQLLTEIRADYQSQDIHPDVVASM